jgi:hypothetical protein
MPAEDYSVIVSTLGIPKLIARGRAACRQVEFISFDIKNGKTVYEVGVDAQSGKVLENAAEGAHPDRGGSRGDGPRETARQI